MFRSLALALLSVAATAAVASAAEPLTFQLENKSSSSITGFYASLAGTQAWGDNMVKADVAPETTATVTLNGPEGVCDFDIKTEFEDESEVIEDGITLCGDITYTVSDKE